MPSSPGPGDTGIAATPPIDATPTTHATCPPEEDRSSGSSTRDELGITDGLRNVSMERNQPARIDPPTEAQPNGDPEALETFSKHVEVADSGDLPSESPSPVIPQEEQQHESRAQHSSTSPATPWQQYILPRAGTARVHPNSTSSYLRPGSKFEGTQQSDRQVYNVQVEIKYVDMEESFLCGYLRIQGLTDDHPTLTTYFEGEIVGNKHTFKTSHPEWGSSEKVDMQHWARFPAWKPLAKQAKSSSFSFMNFAQREHLFMRWKEYFLVPDHKVKTITGASFEGFYYISFNQCSGNVSGIYFHAKSEKYQQLELKHVDDRGCMAAVEFR